VAIDPTAEQITALTRSAHEGPVQMINLLQFKPEEGRESYQRYAEEVGPHLERVGGRIVAGSAALQTLIGENDRPWWDMIATVEYPSIQAFIEMVSDEGYQAIARHRTEALVRAELIATAPAGVA